MALKPTHFLIHVESAFSISRMALQFNVGSKRIVGLCSPLILIAFVMPLLMFAIRMAVAMSAVTIGFVALILFLLPLRAGWRFLLIDDRIGYWRKGQHVKKLNLLCNSLGGIARCANWRISTLRLGRLFRIIGYLNIPND